MAEVTDSLPRLATKLAWGLTWRILLAAIVCGWPLLAWVFLADIVKWLGGVE